MFLHVHAVVYLHCISFFWQFPYIDLIDVPPDSIWYVACIWPSLNLLLNLCFYSLDYYISRHFKHPKSPKSIVFLVRCCCSMILIKQRVHLIIIFLKKNTTTKNSYNFVFYISSFFGWVSFFNPLKLSIWKTLILYIYIYVKIKNFIFEMLFGGFFLLFIMEKEGK